MGLRFFARWLDEIKRRRATLLIRVEVQQIKTRIAELETECANLPSESEDQRSAARAEIRMLKVRLTQLSRQLESASVSQG